MKKKTISAYILATLLTVGMTGAQAAAGMLAEGDISVYKEGHLKNTITGKAPVDEEALLVCNQQCKLKSTGVSLIGKAGTELAVKSEQEQFNLLLKKGQVDFVLSGTVGKMGFYTVDRQYARADVIYNAGTETPVRGYMQLTSTGETRIGIYEGRLVFNTVKGAKTVDSNNYIVLAQAELGSSAADSSESVADANDDGDWECNNDNIGRMCGDDDWYCDDDKIGKECDADIAAGAVRNVRSNKVWNNKALLGSAVVTGAAAWGIYEYFDDDDDPAPRVHTAPASSGIRSASPNM